MEAGKPVLFIDFDGTICPDRFWRSLPPAQYQLLQDKLFGENLQLIGEWMRGGHTAEEINHYVSDMLGSPYEEVWGIFVRDCETMHVSRVLLERLAALRGKYVLVLMTGNMDSFDRFTVPALSLTDYFDEIVNSYSRGKLKDENQAAEFVRCAERYGVPLSVCTAIDDSPRVCAAFAAQGGTALQVTKEMGIESYLPLLER
ncbi:MAG: hypothetical protein JWO84_496 [Parcubacteria group bacterium]|nr:hypothetical protein [Parcubacteria group bacterium]